MFLIIFQVAQFYDPSYVELHTSRGTENYGHKIFMRNSVLIADVLLYVRVHHMFLRILSFSICVIVFFDEENYFSIDNTIYIVLIHYP